MEKKKFKLEDYEGKYAMHCKTEAEANTFCNFLCGTGKHWGNGDSYHNCTHWGVVPGCTCYGFVENTIGSMDSYMQDGFTILEFDDFDWTIRASRTKADYRANIITIMDRQKAKGLKKYGAILEDNKTLSRTQRVEHLEEELIDGLQYCEHLKATFEDAVTGNDYQRMAMRTASHYIGNDIERLITAVETCDEHKVTKIVKEMKFKSRMCDGGLGIAGEAGEVADIIKKWAYQGHELDKEHLKEELGDVLWYIALIADSLDIPMDEVMQINIDKLKKRYPKGFSKEASINREEK